MAATLTFALLSAVKFVSALSPTSIETYLEDNLSSSAEVYLRSDPGYSANLTARWNAFEAPSYVVGVKPATALDVSTIIKYAQQNGIAFMGTGGGHGYTVTTGAINDGINIDLSGFDSVVVDKTTSKLTIGGAVTFGEIFDPVFAAGKEIQTGSCSCVGMVGATLGGGIGPYQGLHGMIIDALESVTIVTGKGDILNASASENSDLFWGIRGAGQNFGIITSATFTLHDQTNGGYALNGDFFFAPSDNATIYQILKSFTQDQPDALSLTTTIQYSAEHNSTVIMVNAVYIGEEATGREVLAPFLNANALKQNVTMLPWNRLTKENRFGADPLGCITGLNQAAYGLNSYKFDIATYQAALAAYVDFYKETGLVTSYMVAEFFPRRVTLQTPDNATAYPYRDTLAYLFFSFSGFTEGSQAATIDTFAKEQRASFAKLNGQKGLEVYVNYAHGDEGRNAWYTAAKLPTLESLKSSWDPYNLFNFTNGFTY